MRTRTTTRVWKKVAAALLTFAMILGAVSGTAQALAEESVIADKTVACLSTSGIAATNHKFSGSYVYYGKYDGTNTTKYRVLDNKTTSFGGTTMLLDCDTYLAYCWYHDSSNVWNGSMLQSWVQGDDFLTKDGNFTTQESDAIALSNKTGDGNESLTDEKTFVLSVSEARLFYPADEIGGTNPSRAKGNGNVTWWLRSASPHKSDEGTYAVVVNENGFIVDADSTAAYHIRTENIGVSPAFNIDLSSVIFSSLVKEAVPEESGPEYKLTIKDDSLTATGSATLDGTKATIAYSTTGEVTQASYLITDAEWDEDEGWTWGETAPSIYAYGSLDETGIIQLPDACKPTEWGTSYHVYVLAETLCDGVATDYASAPYEVAAPTTYTVSVVADPKAGGTAKASADVASEGVIVALEAEAADGYDFAGWTVTSEGATLEDADKPTAKLTVGIADATATAHFREKAAATHKVTLTGGGNARATGGATKQDVGEGEAMAAVTYAAEGGYRFEGFEPIKSNGVTAELRDGKVVVSGTPTADVAITVPDAVRDPSPAATHRVTAKADPEAGGKAEASAGEAAEGASVTLTATSADGYEFVRWTVEGAGARVDDAGRATARLTVGTADVTATATFRAKGQPAPAGATVSYAGHVQDVGDVGPVADGDTCGTTGRGLRLEAIGARVEGGTIEYRGHVQDQGWEGSWAADGATSGTVGEGLRLEAIQMRLAGGLAATHDAFYRVHVQNLGWLGWARDGEVAGTAGKGLRAEAVEVVVLPRGQVPEGYDATDPSFVGYTQGNAHVQGRGWQAVRDESSLLGTTGRGLRMEALSIRPGALPDDLTGSVEYASHVQGVGWEPGWAADGSLSGTTGRGLRVEAVRVRLTGDVSARYSVWYRVHVQNRGWSGWACGGDPAGSEGLSLRAEAVELRVLPVGAPAPGPTEGAMLS